MVYGIFVLLFLVMININAMESGVLGEVVPALDAIEEQVVDLPDDANEQLDEDEQMNVATVDQEPEAITEPVEVPAEDVSAKTETQLSEVEVDNQDTVDRVKTKAEKSEDAIDAEEASRDMPSAPEEQVEVIPEKEALPDQEADEIQGIDTLGLEEPRGNWLFKRIWWERAEGRYDKIRQVVDQINDVYITFFAQRTELDKAILDPFYLDIGFKQGELQAVLTDLISRMEQERQQEGTLSQEDQELLASMQQEREFLQTLHRNAENVLLLDQAADAVIERVMEQKNRVARYEQEAWGYMREIARILSDKQARELYYKMDSAWRNIKSIHQYLERDLQQYFAQLITDAQSQVQRIKDAVQALKEKGFDLKEKAQAADEQEQVVSDEQDEEVAIEVKPKPQKPKGIFGYAKWAMQGISNAVLWLPRMIWRAISSLFGFK